MKKGFKDIEEYFLRMEAKRLQQKVAKPVKAGREGIASQIKSLNEKLKGRDRKIRELYGEIAELKSALERKNRDLEKVDEYLKNIEDLKGEVAKLKEELAEKDRQIESLKAKELSWERVELFVEVALGAVSELAVAGSNMKVFFSKRFRKDMVREVSSKPFLFTSFISALVHMDSTSRLIKSGGKHDIYRIKVSSPYGEYRAIYTRMDSTTLKFFRFGQKDSIYRELDECGWSFD